jgi:sugar lactone lactonase YvrE
MYFTDMPTAQILAYEYDVDGGELHEPRLFADCSHERGLPDGSTVDADGCLWNARWGGGCVVRHRPDGIIDRVVEIPTSHPTCVGFGGDDLGTLFVTTARFGLTSAQLAREPAAGGVFAVDAGVGGVPEPAFAE